METGATFPRSADRGFNAHADAIDWLTAAAVAGLVVVLYAAVVIDLASEWWTDSSASYGMLIPPTALYIAYLRRQYTLAVPARRELRGLWLAFTGLRRFSFGEASGRVFPHSDFTRSIASGDNVDLLGLRSP